MAARGDGIKFTPETAREANKSYTFEARVQARAKVSKERQSEIGRLGALAKARKLSPEERRAHAVAAGMASKASPRNKDPEVVSARRAGAAATNAKRWGHRPAWLVAITGVTKLPSGRKVKAQRTVRKLGMDGHPKEAVA